MSIESTYPLSNIIQTNWSLQVTHMAAPEWEGDEHPWNLMPGDGVSGHLSLNLSFRAANFAMKHFSWDNRIPS